MSTIIVSPHVAQATVRQFGTKVMAESMEEKVDFFALSLRVATFCESL